jgi:hypothetical protein
MKFVGLFSGNAPTILKFQVGEAFATAGVPAVVAGSNDGGVKKASTTAAVSTIGVTLDTAPSFLTAQQADNSDPSRYVSIIVNPGAIYNAKLSGGATENTALGVGLETLGSPTGLLVTTQIDYSSPSMDEGGILCMGGANAGSFRKITSLSSTAAVPTVAFTNDTAIGDQFIATPFNFMAKQFVQLTTLLTQVNAGVTIAGSNNNFVPLKLILPADLTQAANNTSIDMVLYDSIYAAGAQ